VNDGSVPLAQTNFIRCLNWPEGRSTHSSMGSCCANYTRSRRLCRKGAIRNADDFAAEVVERLSSLGPGVSPYLVTRPRSPRPGLTGYRKAKNGRAPSGTLRVIVAGIGCCNGFDAAGRPKGWLKLTLRSLISLNAG
jgi:hypothetical protein